VVPADEDGTRASFCIGDCAMSTGRLQIAPTFGVRGRLWRERHAPPPIFPPPDIFSCIPFLIAHIACVTTPNARAPGPLWFMQRRYASFLAKPALSWFEPGPRRR
jgi:hypothetical protein